jgi:hypothetical protein
VVVAGFASVGLVILSALWIWILSYKPNSVVTMGTTSNSSYALNVTYIDPVNSPNSVFVANRDVGLNRRGDNIVNGCLYLGLWDYDLETPAFRFEVVCGSVTTRIPNLNCNFIIATLLNT